MKLRCRAEFEFGAAATPGQQHDSLLEHVHWQGGGACHDALFYVANSHPALTLVVGHRWHPVDWVARAVSMAFMFVLGLAFAGAALVSIHDDCGPSYTQVEVLLQTPCLDSLLEAQSERSPTFTGTGNSTTESGAGFSSCACDVHLVSSTVVSWPLLLWPVAFELFVSCPCARLIHRRHVTLRGVLEGTGHIVVYGGIVSVLAMAAVMVTSFIEVAGVNSILTLVALDVEAVIAALLLWFPVFLSYHHCAWRRRAVWRDNLKLRRMVLEGTTPLQTQRTGRVMRTAAAARVTPASQPPSAARGRGAKESMEESTATFRFGRAMRPSIRGKQAKQGVALAMGSKYAPAIPGKVGGLPKDILPPPGAVDEPGEVVVWFTVKHGVRTRRSRRPYVQVQAGATRTRTRCATQRWWTTNPTFNDTVELHLDPTILCEGDVFISLKSGGTQCGWVSLRIRNIVTGMGEDWYLPLDKNGRRARMLQRRSVASLWERCCSRCCGGPGELCVSAEFSPQASKIAMGLVPTAESDAAAAGPAQDSGSHELSAVERANELLERLDAGEPLARSAV